MVEQDFIDKFKFVIEALEKKRGPIILFALFRMDEITDKWTVILSADWATRTEYSSIFNDLRNFSFQVLNSKEQAQIARSGIFSPDNHLVQMILEKYDGENHNIKDEKINGNYIHEGYILRANRLLLEKVVMDKNQEKLL